MCHRHGHDRFINLVVRMSKGGKTTSDVHVLRVYSCFKVVPQEEQNELGRSTFVRCPAQLFNLASLHQGLLRLAMEHPLVGMDPLLVNEGPLFPSTSARTQRGAVGVAKAMPEKEINSRFPSTLVASARTW